MKRGGYQVYFCGVSRDSIPSVFKIGTYKVILFLILELLYFPPVFFLVSLYQFTLAVREMRSGKKWKTRDTGRGVAKECGCQAIWFSVVPQWPWWCFPLMVPGKLLQGLEVRLAWHVVCFPLHLIRLIRIIFENVKNENLCLQWQLGKFWQKWWNKQLPWTTSLGPGPLQGSPWLPACVVSWILSDLCLWFTSHFCTPSYRNWFVGAFWKKKKNTKKHIDILFVLFCNFVSFPVLVSGGLSTFSCIGLLLSSWLRRSTSSSFCDGVNVLSAVRTAATRTCWVLEMCLLWLENGILHFI